MFSCSHIVEQTKCQAFYGYRSYLNSLVFNKVLILLKFFINKCRFTPTDLETWIRIVMYKFSGVEMDQWNSWIQLAHAWGVLFYVQSFMLLWNTIKIRCRKKLQRDGNQKKKTWFYALKEFQQKSNWKNTTEIEVGWTQRVYSKT